MMFAARTIDAGCWSFIHFEKLSLLEGFSLGKENVMTREKKNGESGDVIFLLLGVSQIRRRFRSLFSWRLRRRNLFTDGRVLGGRLLATPGGAVLHLVHVVRENVAEARPRLLWYGHCRTVIRFYLVKRNCESILSAFMISRYTSEMRM